MEEIFNFAASNRDGSSSNDSGTAESFYPDVADMEWQTAGVDGFWLKPLLKGIGGDIETWLMKVDAGAYAPSHTHDRWEQIYVIDGSFYDQNRVLNAGDFVYRAPGAPHTSGSEHGAHVLLVYSSADLS